MNKHDLRKGMLVKALRDVDLYEFHPAYGDFLSVGQLVSISYNEVLMLISIEFSHIMETDIPVSGSKRYFDVFGFLFGEKIVYNSFYLDNGYSFTDIWKILTP